MYFNLGMANSDLQQSFNRFLRTGRFAPGDKLETEVELARRFNVSRGAMREVLMHFSLLGILERVKNKGTFIKAVSPEAVEGYLSVCFQLSAFGFEELKEARFYLESLIVPLSARRLSPAMIERLTQNIEEMEQRLGDPETADQLDRNFHLLLMEACGNRVLKLFSSVIYLLFHKKYRERFQTLPALRKSVNGHKGILKALVAGDAILAQRLLEEHIRPT